MDAFEIFLVTAPGLEAALAGEARRAGFATAKAVEGGVTLAGGWPDVWRANIALRGATRVLVRIAQFRALHLAQLDKRARRVPWGDFLRRDVPVQVEAACRRSRIYHAGAAAERVATAIAEAFGAPGSTEALLRILVRIEDDLVTISIDTSGDSLHRRGHKEAVNRAPMRETMAALFLMEAGYDGRERLLDPMCGSGTFVIEAAEMAAGLLPGRTRRFAFELLPSHDAGAVAALRGGAPATLAGPHCFGSDRDEGAIAMSRANAERAGVGGITAFQQATVSTISPPEGAPGLVMVNPPYGTRIGDKRNLTPLYAAMGQTLMKGFAGWRVGIVTTEARLAQATRLPLLPPGPPVLHGGLRVRLFQTGPLR